MNTLVKATLGTVAALTLVQAFAQMQPQYPPATYQQPYPGTTMQGGLPIVPKAGYQPTPYYQGGALYDVRPGDMTVRDVLTRWAQQTGWTHKPEHWAIDRDLPISGTADASAFGFDFKMAVRKLLASTEMTDRPVQPCFYSNHVVRVVPRAELCDRNSQ